MAHVGSTGFSVPPNKSRKNQDQREAPYGQRLMPKAPSIPELNIQY